MKEKYKLLKDLPDLKAGAIFEWDEDGNYYKSGDKQIWIGGTQKFHSFTAGTVTLTPEWFEKISESKIYLTRQNLEALLVTCVPSYYTNSWITGKIDEFLSKIPKEPFREQKLYSMNDMVQFAGFVVQELKGPVVPIDSYLLDKWIQKAHPEDCVIPEKK